FFRGYVARLGRKIGIGRSGQSAVGSQQLAVRSSGSVLTAHGSQLTTHFSPLSAHHSPTNIAIFASGAGSNAQKIIDHFRNSSLVKISLIVCNKKKAGVLQIAEKENMPFLVIEKEKFF